MYSNSDKQVQVLAKNQSGLAVYGLCLGLPSSFAISASNYALGCVLVDTVNGGFWRMNGTTAAPTWENTSTINTAEIADLAVTEAKLSASSGFGLGALRVARAKYDFAVDGGAFGVAKTLATNCLIPNNAIIVGGILNSTTPLISAGGTMTINIGTTAGSSANSLKAAGAEATFTLDALVATIPVFTAASSVKMTAAGQVTLTPLTENCTGGVLEITLFYFVAAA